MIIQATVYRVKDGLPLVASTDMDGRSQVKACQKYTKLISKRLYKFPDRCSLQLEGYHIHFITALGLTFLALCEESYPTVLAFSFLDEIQREFIVNYDDSRIQALKRPYAFIEFDMFLQKSKQRYNNPRSLTTKINLSDVSTELRLRPPYIIQEPDLEPVNNGVYSPKQDTRRPILNPGRKLVPVDWVAVVSMLLNLFCVLLNITRGMAIISHGHFDELDHGAYRYGLAFFVTALLYAYMMYLILHCSSWRRLQCLFILTALAWCCYVLRHFRNILQVAFHITVGVFAVGVILKRQFADLLPRYAV